MRILKEPLLHFLVAGAALFCVYSWRSRGGAERPGVERPVRIGAGDVQWLRQTWLLQWQREPTPQELRSLVTEFLREELLAREAREMGLDQDDTVVRRRLAQKVTFLIEDNARLAEPTGDELRRYYEAHPDQFRNEPRVSFEHIYFNPRRRQNAAGDARVVLANLSNSAAQDAAAGDRLLIEPEFHDADRQTVAGSFGRDFASAVFALRPGQWRGPIESSYGLHLVRVSESKAGEQRPFDEVSAQVRDAWERDRQAAAIDRYLAALHKKYRVVVDERVRPLFGTLETTSATEVRE
jgi:hypothetical protein